MKELGVLVFCGVVYGVASVVNGQCCDSGAMVDVPVIETEIVHMEEGSEMIWNVAAIESPVVFDSNPVWVEGEFEVMIEETPVMFEESVMIMEVPVVHHIEMMDGCGCTHFTEVHSFIETTPMVF